MFKRLKARRKLAALIPELQQLRQALQRESKVGDPLTLIVYFFDIVSKWHDRGLTDIIAELERVKFRGRYDEIIEKLKTLQGHFVNAGRDPYGMNRTKRGQMVTEDNVYLGNIYGLFTKTVRFWKQRKGEPKGGWGFSNMEHLNPFDVVSRQAREFMMSHAGMIKLIDKLAVL